MALARLGQAARAVSRLRHAVRLQGDSAEARLALAEALTRLGRHREAVPEWQELVRLQPRQPAH